MKEGLLAKAKQGIFNSTVQAGGAERSPQRLQLEVPLNSNFSKHAQAVIQNLKTTHVLFQTHTESSISGSIFFPNCILHPDPHSLVEPNFLNRVGSWRFFF
jgi:hypothetical protein